MLINTDSFFMDCEKSDVSGWPMEPPPTESPIPDADSVEDATPAARSDMEPAQQEGSAWRDELSAKLNRYRARRKAPPPRYPSLKLPFGPLESSVRTTGSEAPVFESVANHALALDEVHPAPYLQEISTPESFAEAELAARPATSHAGAKIIEFPRFAWGPPPPPPDQLAEPVMERPRILEVPEVAPPPPALGGILIEPAQKQELEKRPGIDIPLQSARLSLRLLASLIDGMIIALASVLFGFIFWKVTSIRPPRLQIVALAAGIACVLWAAYQYLLVVYSGTTPGLRAARLELTRFDGSLTRRSLRRWRVLASYLSFASLGMGYVWLFLDEDALCWHDRITHTYLAPRKTSSK
jgi:uncharacterized RDD family membrane protein YckC